MTRLAICLLLLGWLQLCLAQTNQTKAICYSGSSLYQQITQNCNDQDPSYQGVWYCAKMEICESFMSDKRQCIETRGCATEQECTSNGVPYSGQVIESSGQYPAGMKITATCCAAHDFPDDDTVAIDFKDVCNAAPGPGASMAATAAWVAVAAASALTALYSAH